MFCWRTYCTVRTYPLPTLITSTFHSLFRPSCTSRTDHLTTHKPSKLPSLTCAHGEEDFSEMRVKVWVQIGTAGKTRIVVESDDALVIDDLRKAIQTFQYIHQNGWSIVAWRLRIQRTTRRCSYLIPWWHDTISMF